MRTLEERLADLADQAEVPVAAAPAADLWRRGRRHGRRRTALAGVALVAAVVVAAVGAGATAHLVLPSEVDPAASSGTAVLPDRFFDPSDRLDWVTDAGPVGPLVAVLPTEHGSVTGAGRPDLVGVSAATQAYRFLDLPDFPAEGMDSSTGTRDIVWSLSPDGRWLAYWYTGEVPGRGANAFGSTLVGLAVYDTVTGEVTRRPVDSELGLSPSASMSWAGDRLWFSEWEITETSTESQSSHRTGVFVWDLGTDRVTTVDRGATADDSTAPGPDGSFLAVSGPRVRVVREPADLTAAPTVRIGRAVDRVALSPDGTRVAASDQTDDAGVVAGDALLVGTVTDGRADLAELDGWRDRYADLLGWRDATTVVVQTGGGDHTVLEAVDVRTGESTRLVDLGVNDHPLPVLATDLLAAPVVTGEAPPGLRTPVRAATGAGLVVLLGGVVLLRRRRRASA